MALKIKPQFASRTVAFGGMGKRKLGEWPEADLRKLAILAQQSKDRSLLEVFDGALPTVADLQREETQQKLNPNPTLKGPEATKGSTPGGSNLTDKQKTDKA